MKITRIIALAASLTLGVSAAAQAQGRTHVGPRVGYNFDFEAAVLGIQFSVPVKPTLEFLPSFDFIIVDVGSAFGINLDMKFRPLRSADWMYVGAGVNMTHTKAFAVSNTDPGVNLIGGVELRKGNVHPFAEFRWTSGKSSSSALLAGVNVTLGGSH